MPSKKTSPDHESTTTRFVIGRWKLDNPLSLCREERRRDIARTRVVRQFLNLMNALRDAGIHEPDDREVYLQMHNVAHAMITLITVPSLRPQKRMRKLEQQALKLLHEVNDEKHKSMEMIANPSADYDLPLGLNMTGAKLALLDLVDEAAKGVPYGLRSTPRGRFDTKVMSSVLAKDVSVDDRDALERAEVVASTILVGVHSDNRFHNLLKRIPDPNELLEDIRKLTLVIAKLMDDSSATATQLARGVVFVFGGDKTDLKNLITKKIVEDWEAKRRLGSQPG